LPAAKKVQLINIKKLTESKFQGTRYAFGATERKSPLAGRQNRAYGFPQVRPFVKRKGGLVSGFRTQIFLTQVHRNIPVPVETAREMPAYREKPRCKSVAWLVLVNPLECPGKRLLGKILGIMPVLDLSVKKIEQGSIMATDQLREAILGAGHRLACQFFRT